MLGVYKGNEPPSDGEPSEVETERFDFIEAAAEMQMPIDQMWEMRPVDFNVYYLAHLKRQRIEIRKVSLYMAMASQSPEFDEIRNYEDLLYILNEKKLPEPEIVEVDEKEYEQMQNSNLEILKNLQNGKH